MIFASENLHLSLQLGYIKINKNGIIYYFYVFFPSTYIKFESKLNKYKFAEK